MYALLLIFTVFCLPAIFTGAWLATVTNLADRYHLTHRGWAVAWVAWLMLAGAWLLAVMTLAPTTSGI